MRLNASLTNRMDGLALGVKSLGSGTRLQMKPVETEASIWPKEDSQMRFSAENSVLL